MLHERVSLFVGEKVLLRGNHQSDAQKGSNQNPMNAVMRSQNVRQKMLAQLAPPTALEDATATKIAVWHLNT
jgi:hypothetical protein